MTYTCSATRRRQSDHSATGFHCVSTGSNLGKQMASTSSHSSASLSRRRFTAAQADFESDIESNIFTDETEVTSGNGVLSLSLTLYLSSTCFVCLLLFVSLFSLLFEQFMFARLFCVLFCFFIPYMVHGYSQKTF